MKSKKNLSILTIFVISCFALSSCSNKLDRDNAKKLIIQKYQYPKADLKDFPLSVSAGEILYCHTFSGDKYEVAEYHQGFMPNWKLSTSAKYSDETSDVPTYALFETIKNKGLITYTSKKVKTTQEYKNAGNKVTYFDCYHYASFTELGNKYVSNGMIAIDTTEFGEVTGIVENKESNTTEVKYTTVTKVTPFGEVYNLTGRTNNCSATFKKYDDGWRVE